MCAGDILRGGRTRRQNSLTDLELFPALSSRYLRFPDRIRITTSATARGILLWIKDLDCWSRTTEMQNVRSSSDNRDHTFEARRDAWKKGIAVELRWGRGPRPPDLLHEVETPCARCGLVCRPFHSRFLVQSQRSTLPEPLPFGT